MDLEKKLVDAFLLTHPEEAAHTFNHYSISTLVELLENADPKAAACTLRHVMPNIASDTLRNMQHDKATRVLNELPMDARLVFLQRMDSSSCELILDGLKKSAARSLRRLLNYPEGSAGKLMDPNAVAVQSTSTVREAMKQVRTKAQAVRYYIYVLDKDRRLVGVVTLRQLLQAKMTALVSSVMEQNVVSLSSMDSERDIVNHRRWKDFHALPVVNQDRVLVGVIQYETLGRLKEARSKIQDERDLGGTLLALGELYMLGMTGTLDSIASPSGQVAPDTGNNTSKARENGRQ